jgi:outer membrane biosynthesis protein TonB
MTAVTSTTRARALNRGFARIIILSLLLHLGILGGVVYAQYAKGRAKREFHSIPVQLVKLGKKRDPNLLPQLVKPASAPPPTDEGIALDTQNKDKPNQKTKDQPKSKEPKMSDAAKRLLEDAKLDERYREVEDEGDPNGSIYGTTTDATNAATGYLAEVSIALQKAYTLPKTIADSERRFLSAEVVLYIESDGTISKFEFGQIHPNEAFRQALESMLKTLKLPPPPKELAEEYRTDGIPVRFKPQ